MRRNLIPYVALVAAFGLGACSDKSLEVTNPNSGETQRVLGTPDDAEKLGCTEEPTRLLREPWRAWPTSCPFRTTRA